MLPCTWPAVGVNECTCGVKQHKVCVHSESEQCYCSDSGFSACHPRVHDPLWVSPPSSSEKGDRVVGARGRVRRRHSGGECVSHPIIPLASVPPPLIQVMANDGVQGKFCSLQFCLQGLQAMCGPYFAPHLPFPCSTSLPPPTCL